MKEQLRYFSHQEESTNNSFPGFISTPPMDMGGSGNTPHNLQTPYTVKLDYITLLADITSFDVVPLLIQDLSDLFTDGFESHHTPYNKGRIWTGGYAVSLYGTLITWDSLQTPNPRIRISIPGKACSRINALDLATWLNGLSTFPFLRNLQCSRLDAAFDDHTKQLFSYGQLRWAFNNRAYMRLRKPTVHTSGLPTDPYGQGWSFRLGGSRKSIIFYNKAAESNGQIDAHRIEARYGEDDANEAFQCLMQFPICDFEQFAIAFLAGLVSGVVDFCTFPKGRSHGARDSKRLGWWQRVLDVTQSILRFSARPCRPNLCKKVEWIERQVSTSLAQIHDVIELVGGPSFDVWLSHMIVKGKQKYRKLHQEFIHVSQLEYERKLTNAFQI